MLQIIKKQQTVSGVPFGFLRQHFGHTAADGRLLSRDLQVVLEALQVAPCVAGLRGLCGAHPDAGPPSHTHTHTDTQTHTHTDTHTHVKLTNPTLKDPVQLSISGQGNQCTNKKNGTNKHKNSKESRTLMDGWSQTLCVQREVSV